MGTFFIRADCPADQDFEQLMVRNGDLICYRETEVQAYARLTAELDPTLLVAWNLSQWLEESSNPTAKDIQRIVAVQDTFCTAG